MNLVLFTFMEVWAFSQGYHYLQVNGHETLYALHNETAKIRCISKYALSHCGFEDPNGKKYTFTDLTESDGQCEMSFTITNNNTGLWKCNMVANFTKLEETKKVLVKMGKPLSAVESNVTVEIGSPTTVACISLRSSVSLCHCMFKTPYGESFHIDENVTKENSILSRFYFPSNQSLSKGYCSVSIKSVEQRDFGYWTCEAGCPSQENNTDIIFMDIGDLSWLKGKAFGIIIFGIVIATIIAFIVVLMKVRNICMLDETTSIEMTRVVGTRQSSDINFAETRI